MPPSGVAATSTGVPAAWQVAVTSVTTHSKIVRFMLMVVLGKRLSPRAKGEQGVIRFRSRLLIVMWQCPLGRRQVVQISPYSPPFHSPRFSLLSVFATLLMGVKNITSHK